MPSERKARAERPGRAAPATEAKRAKRKRWTTAATSRCAGRPRRRAGAEPSADGGVGRRARPARARPVQRPAAPGASRLRRLACRASGKREPNVPGAQRPRRRRSGRSGNDGPPPPPRDRAGRSRRGAGGDPSADGGVGRRARPVRARPAPAGVEARASRRSRLAARASGKREPNVPGAQRPRRRRSGRSGLEEPHRAPVRPDVDVERGRMPAEPGHLLHLAAERDEPAGARVGADVADRDGESAWGVPQLRVV